MLAADAFLTDGEVELSAQLPVATPRAQLSSKARMRHIAR